MQPAVSLIVQLTRTRWWVGEGGLETFGGGVVQAPPPPAPSPWKKFHEFLQWIQKKMPGAFSYWITVCPLSCLHRLQNAPCFSPED